MPALLALGRHFGVSLISHAVREFVKRPSWAVACARYRPAAGIHFLHVSLSTL